MPKKYLPRVTEYSDPVVNANWHTSKTIATATAAVHGYPIATLAYRTAGYQQGGSMAVWSAEGWSVSYDFDGGIHGQRFAPEDETAARDYFAKLTDPTKVTARRESDERLEREVYGPARIARAAEIAADKAAKAARAKARRLREVDNT